MKFDGVYHIQVFVAIHICLLSVTTFYLNFTQILQNVNTHIARKESSVIIHNMQIWIWWLWNFKTEYIVLPIVFTISANGSFPTLKIVAVCLNNHGTYVDDRPNLVAQNLLRDRVGEFSVLPFLLYLNLCACEVP